MPIPKKTRDAAMQLILDFHQHREPMHTIGPAYLDHNLKSWAAIGWLADLVHNNHLAP